MERSTNTSDWIRTVDMVFPQDANPPGNMFGGRDMLKTDAHSAIACFRFCRKAAVTASSEPIDFRAPINVGDVIEVCSRIAWTGRTSMIVRNEVYGENPLTGKRLLCTIGHMNFVAIDGNGRPIEVPMLERRTPEEEEHWAQGVVIRGQILARRGAAR